MDENQLNKLIGYTVLAIIAYHVLQLVAPFLFYGVIGMVVWRIFQEHQKHK